MMTLGIRKCIKCRYDLRGTVGSTCPECGLQQPDDAFELEILQTNLAPERQSRREWIVGGAMLILLSVLVGTGRIGLCSGIGILLFGTIAVVLLLRGYAWIERARGVPDMYVLFDHRGIHRIREGRDPAQLVRWKRPYRFRFSSARAGRWQLKCWVPAFAMSSSGPTTLILVFDASAREAAVIRRFIKTALNDETSGRIKQARSW